MGIKKASKYLALFFLVLAIPVNVKAADNTAIKLYQEYDMSFSPVYPEDTIEILNSYAFAERYIYMFRYVDKAQAEDGNDVIESRIKTITEECATIKKQLVEGYYLSESEIYQLESDYANCMIKLDKATKSLESVKVDYSIPSTANTPTYEEYINALNIKDEIDLHTDIGDVKVPMKVPVSSSSVLDSCDNNGVVCNVAEGANVTSLWNGVVKDVTSDSIVIDCYNNILIGYAGLKDIKVNVGDSVYQGQIIATSEKQLKMKLQLNGTSVNLKKLFEEE